MNIIVCAHTHIKCVCMCMYAHVCGLVCHSMNVFVCACALFLSLSVSLPKFMCLSLSLSLIHNYVPKNTFWILTTYNSYLTVIGVYEMHGQMHTNYCQITDLLVVHLCSSLAYFMMTQPLPIAGKLPIKTLVAKQLPTNMYTSVHVHV